MNEKNRIRKLRHWIDEVLPWRVLGIGFLVWVALFVFSFIPHNESEWYQNALSIALKLSSYFHVKELDGFSCIVYITYCVYIFRLMLLAIELRTSQATKNLEKIGLILNPEPKAWGYQPSYCGTKDPIKQPGLVGCVVSWAFELGFLFVTYENFNLVFLGLCAWKWYSLRSVPKISYNFLLYRLANRLQNVDMDIEELRCHYSEIYKIIGLEDKGIEDEFDPFGDQTDLHEELRQGKCRLNRHEQKVNFGDSEYAYKINGTEVQMRLLYKTYDDCVVLYGSTVVSGFITPLGEKKNVSETWLEWHSVDNKRLKYFILSKHPEQLLTSDAKAVLCREQYIFWKAHEKFKGKPKPSSGQGDAEYEREATEFRHYMQYLGQLKLLSLIGEEFIDLGFYLDSVEEIGRIAHQEIEKDYQGLNKELDQYMKSIGKKSS